MIASYELPLSTTVSMTPNRQPSPTAVRTQFVRMAFVCFLYLAAATATLGAYVAALVVVMRMALESSGWTAALIAATVYFTLTAVAAFAGARLVLARLSCVRDVPVTHALSTPASASDSASLPIAAESTPSPSDSTLLAGLFNGAVRLLCNPTARDSLISALSIALAGLTIIGPIRLIRMAARAVRIAATLHAVAQAAAVERRAA